MIIINPIHGISKRGNESGVIMMPDYVATFSQKKKMGISNFSHKQTNKQQQQMTTDIGIWWAKKSIVSMKS